MTRKAVNSPKQVTDRNQKQADRRELEPLMRELKRRIDAGGTYTQFSEQSGTKTHTPSRLFGSQSVASPSYMTLTRMIVATGMTPNQAASLAKLYHSTRRADVVLTEEDDPRLVEAVQIALDPSLSELVRDNLIQTFNSLAIGFKKEDTA